MDKHLINVLYGSSVSVVGGYDQGLEDRAFNSDYVIRCNGHYKRQGRRCDILFTSNYIDAEPDHNWIIPFILVNEDDTAMRKASPKSYITTFSRERSIKRKNNWLHEWSNTFSHELNTDPLCGILAVRWATLLPVKSIFITAMDFYKHETGEFKDYIWPHHITPQIEYLRRLWISDLRVEVDSHLYDLLNLKREERGLIKPTY